MPIITAFFTNAGVPHTGASPLPTITIYEMTGDTEVVSAANMDEVAGGIYKYNFTEDPDVKYAFVCDAGDGETTLQERYVAGSFSGIDASDIPGLVWEELKADHTTADSFGDYLDDEITSRATPTQVNTEVSDVLKTDVTTLPGQEAPPLTPTFEEMVSWLYKVFRNKKEQTATLWSLYDDAGTTVDAKATVEDDNVTVTKEEIEVGP